jgi:hypothetical protein
MASQLLNTTVSGTLKLNKIKLPNGLISEGKVSSWSSGSDGSTITQGYIRNTLDGSITPMNGYLNWGDVFVESVSDDLATYYTPPGVGTFIQAETVSTSTANGSVFSGTYTIESSGNAFLFGGTSSSLVGMPMNGTTQYVSITIPAGHEVSVDFAIRAQTYIKRSSTSIYSCYMPTLYSSIYGYLSTSSALVDPVTQSANIKDYVNLRVPLMTSSTPSNGEVETTLSYKNTTSTSQTIYARIIGRGGVPLTSIKLNSTDSGYCTNGSLVVSFTTTLTTRLIKSAVNIPGTPEAFPAGKPLNLIGYNGNVFIDDSGNMTLDLPNVYYVKRGNYHLKIDSTGVKTSSDGKAWLAK